MTEADRAKAYWATRDPGTTSMTGGVRRCMLIFQAIQMIRRNIRIKSVFEFGCRAGRNLAYVKKNTENLSFAGMDVNANAIEKGKRCFNLDLFVGDESSLEKFSDDVFDVSFTVSVLDHLPDPKHAFCQLLRITRERVILLEPHFQTDGKEQEKPVSQFSYLWNYSALVEESGAVLLRNEPGVFYQRGYGKYFRLFEVRPEATDGTY